MELWVVLSNIILAIATFATAIVAIYLSVSKNKVKFQTSGFLSVVQPGGTNYYTIKIVNKTINIPLRIEHIGIEKINKGSNSALLFNTYVSGLNNVALPKVLEYGESFIYNINMKQANDILKKSNQKVLRCYFYDSVNNKYLVKIPRNDLEELTKRSKGEK